jgi:cytoskeleton protein RodZ
MPAAEPGEILKKAREARGETLSNVAQTLKLSPQQLEALENGRFDILPGPTFVRGFLRNYARYLGVAPEPLLAVLSGRVPATPPVPPPFVSQSRRFSDSSDKSRSHVFIPAMLVVLALAVAGGAYYMDVFDKFNNIEPPAAAPEHANTAQPRHGAVSNLDKTEVGHELALANTSAQANDVKPSDSPTSAAPATESAPAATVPETSLASVAPAEPTVATAKPVADVSEVVAVPPSLNESTLHFEFNVNTWAQVREGSGKIIFGRSVRKNTSLDLKGKPPFEILITQPRNTRIENEVALEFNGRPVNLAGRVQRDGVARLTLK